MPKELVIERMHTQTRLAVLENGKLFELYCEREGREKLSGNVYLGRVMNILPAMEAAFVEIGCGKNAFLPIKDAPKGLHPGDTILCRVVKEPGGLKGPRISCNVTIPGRYTALVPDMKYAAVSKRIEDENERDRLYHIACRVSERSGRGVIARTVAEGASEAEVEQDHLALCRSWEAIETMAAHTAAPAILWSDGSLALRSVRDMLTDDVAAIRCDDPVMYEELCRHAAVFAPERMDCIRYEKTQMPLFDLLRVDHMAEDAYKRCVYMKSGGSIVIDETEAMTVIDVNTGKFTGKGDHRETFLRMNCEAAAEIARQLRLRDIGGIIIIDFIDMDTQSDKEKLLACLSDALRGDRNRTEVRGITSLGLVEMTRKKERIPLNRRMMHECSRCRGTGRERTYETNAYEALRELWRRRRTGDTTKYEIRTDAGTASQLEVIGMFEDADAVIGIGGQFVNYELIPRTTTGEITGDHL